MLIIRDDALGDTLPVYEVKELSLEEALRVITGDGKRVNVRLPENPPATAGPQASSTLTA